MLTRVRGLLARYPELAAVLAAAIIGLTVQRPLAWLAARQGINVLLAMLVFATALTIEPAALRRAATAWRSLLAALAVGVTVLPALAWAVALGVSMEVARLLAWRAASKNMRRIDSGAQ